VYGYDPIIPKDPRDKGIGKLRGSWENEVDEKKRKKSQAKAGERMDCVLVSCV
jgi:hypothetical protein